MYCKFVGDSPFMSGNWRRRSIDNRRITPLPHGSASCPARINCPIRQYSARTSEPTVRATRSRVLRTSAAIRANRSPYSSVTTASTHQTPSPTGTIGAVSSPKSRPSRDRSTGSESSNKPFLVLALVADEKSQIQAYPG